MNRPSKCKNCQWYNKPYWSIINPCDNCPNEKSIITVFKINQEPIFKEYATDEDIKRAMYEKIDFTVELKEKDKEIQRLNNRINKAIEYIENECLDEYKLYCHDLVGNDIYKVLDILKGSDSNE